LTFAASDEAVASSAASRLWMSVTTADSKALAAVLTGVAGCTFVMIASPVVGQWLISA